MAVVLLDFRLEQLLAVCPQTFERTRFVLLHEPAVTDHVGGKNGRKLAFHGTSRNTNPREWYDRLMFENRSMTHFDGATIRRK